MDTRFTVEFHGKYIPLQGVQYIIQAAKLLEANPVIRFVLIGSGQTYAEIRKLADDLHVTTVTFIDKVPYQEIPRYIADADVCLGIFGETNKAQRVIPNKIYEAVAMGKPVITANTMAINEVFTDNENIFLCNAADAHDLAKKILTLYENESLKNSIAINVSKLYWNTLTPEKICSNLIEELIG